MLLAILRICTEEELFESDGESEAVSKANDAEIQKRRQAIKNKIMAVGKLQRAFQKLRYVYTSVVIDRLLTIMTSEDSENASELMISSEDVHGISGEPGDALGVQGYQIGKTVRSFDTACVFLSFYPITTRNHLL
jgi:serine/threonine-protein phosphatase 2B catalytic subunit